VEAVAGNRGRREGSGTVEGPKTNEGALSGAPWPERSAGREDVPLDFPIDKSGWSEFQIRVYEAVRQVRRGETIDYSGVAVQVKSGDRAVGNALRRNSVHLAVPCHRVVKKDGSAGCENHPEWRAVKLRLLAIERARGNPLS
jgi:O-6-methylguanine DNA methyltransferase